MTRPLALTALLLTALSLSTAAQARTWPAI